MYKDKISAVYKIVNTVIGDFYINTVTGDFYIGSSKNVKRRWANHRCPLAKRFQRAGISHPTQEAKKYLI